MKIKSSEALLNSAADTLATFFGVNAVVTDFVQR